MAGLFSPNVTTSPLPSGAVFTNLPYIYPTTQTTTYAPTPQRTSNLIRVKGIDSAKAYPTSPNTDTIMFDEDNDVMYLKSTDASNFPTVRRFVFHEEEDTPVEEAKYVTLEEFNRFKEELINGKQFVRKHDYQYAKPDAGRNAAKFDKKNVRPAEREPESGSHDADIIEAES